MASRPASSTAAHKLVALDDHALGTLRYIRRSMEAAGALAVPGIAGIVTGAVGIVAAALAALPSLQRHELVVWIGAAVLAAPLGGGLMVRRAGRASGVLRNGAARRFACCFTPALLTGAVLTWVLWRSDAIGLIPGVWLLLYGSGLVAAATATRALVGVMGALFMVLGVIAFQAPAAWTNALLGAGFGGLHLIFGVLIGRQADGR